MEALSWMLIIFAVLATLLAVFGARKLKIRRRKGIPKLPAWINPYASFLLGALVSLLAVILAR